MNMEIRKRIITHFTNATTFIYKELTSELVPIVGGLEKNEGNVITLDGYTVILGFKGKFNGRFLLNLPFSEALRLHEVIVGESVNSINDEVLFTVSEMGNMIAGNAVTRINDEFEGADIRLSPPSVFVGNDVKFFNFKINAYNILLKTPKHHMRINIAIGEETK